MSHTPIQSVMTVGETMAQLAPEESEDLSHTHHLTLSAAGAESTVAMYLARLGVPTAWVSRVGSDPFGARVLRMVRRYGVDTHSVQEDSGRPTGVYFKDPHPGGTTVYYYRSGSAASALSRADFPWEELSAATLVHTTGITLALSSSTADLVEALITARAAHHHIVSVDVNYRPALWIGRDAAASLLKLARRADIVFVGLDEARTLWETDTAEDVRRILAAPRELIVKDAEVGATAFTPEGRIFLPSEKVDVIESVGAGDSFAAGYLYESIRGGSITTRIQFGHRLAARVLRTTSDFVDPGE